ncbi:hypothetical protein NSQ62_08360 [Solibacillus sp. FSL H8-0523]|uniref:hypothetical protein n=1 Tax=Solibacillus sp. FSL H8-0523 TaxID=2954511 RepID=UPI0031014EBE
MTIHSDSNSEQIAIQFTLKVTDLEINKHMKLVEALKKSRRIQLPTFFLSLLFVLFVWALLNTGRTWADNFVVKEIVVNFGFNLVFTFGFSYALLYLLNFKNLANLFVNGTRTSDVEDKKGNRLFVLNMIIGFVLTMLFTMTLYQLWIKGDAISPLIDFAILCAIFIHMLLGLNCYFTIRKVKKISREYHRKIILLINEYELLKDVTSDKVEETNETMVN